MTPARRRPDGSAGERSTSPAIRPSRSCSAAQARGHQLFHYLADDLTYAGRAALRRRAPGHGAARSPGDHFRLGEFTILDLGRDVDVVLMRQDPPFDLGYITATHLLERIQDETLVVNDPAAVRNAPEKVWVLDFARFMPPTLLTRSLGAAREFLAEHGEIVVKPLHGNAGKAVFKVGRDGANLAPLIELFNADLSRAARRPGLPSRGRRGRQAHRPGRRRGRRARSTACPARARSAPTSPPAARRRRPS